VSRHTDQSQIGVWEKTSPKTHEFWIHEVTNSDTPREDRCQMVNSRRGQRQVPSGIGSRGSVRTEDHDSTSDDFLMGKFPIKARNPWVNIHQGSGICKTRSREFKTRDHAKPNFSKSRKLRSGSQLASGIEISRVPRT
jgi:hypothetical protein